MRTCKSAQVDRAKVLSNTIKQKRKEKAGKWEVPLPKVRSLGGGGLSEREGLCAWQAGSLCRREQSQH